MSSARPVVVDGVAGVFLSVDDAALLASAAGRFNEQRAAAGHGRYRRLAVLHDDVLAATHAPVDERPLAGSDTGPVMVDTATAGAARGVSASEVTRLARLGRIPGAVKLGRGRAGRWVVPCAPSATNNGENLT